jgi:probable O-glycosylation ligase (exosortase A-associated)
VLSDLLWVMLIGIFIVFGLKKPYIALSGVLFVDILKPQNLSFNFLADRPLAFVITLVFFISLTLNGSQWRFPKVIIHPFFLIFFMIWITITTYHAEFQFVAWYKYDYSFKTILFCLFIPFVLLDKRQYEFAIAIIVFATSYYFVAAGLSTVFESAYYGKPMIKTRIGDNSIMTESSTLAMTAVMMMPFMYQLAKHSRFAVKVPYFKLLLGLCGFAALVTIIGSYARTGLVGLVVLGGFVFMKSKYKFRISIAITCVSIFMLMFTTSNWKSRMLTVGESKKEASALGRIIVWKWTLDYVAERPILGGGFMSYIANAGQLVKYGDESVNVDYKADSGKAFHNIYFEVLGEHGYVGLLIFLLILYNSWKLNRRVIKGEHSTWLTMSAQATNLSLIIFCVCGMFIGVAFSPWAYIFFGLSVSLYQIYQMESLKNEKN